MKKYIILLSLALPLSMWGQKTQARAVASSEQKPIKFDVELVSDTLRFKTYIYKTDTSIFFIDPIIRPDLGKFYLQEIAKTDTLSSSKKVGVIEFFITEYPLSKWAAFKTQATAVKSSDTKKAEEEKAKQDRVIERQKERDKILKADKN